MRRQRLVTDYRGRTRNWSKCRGQCWMRATVSRFDGVPAFSSSDLLRGYWKMPLAEEPQDIFTIVVDKVVAEKTLASSIL